jgi:hypothetical protein
VNLNNPFLSSQFPHIIQLMQMKAVNCRQFLVHNIYEATNTMVNEWCILMYAISVLGDNLLDIFILAQASTCAAWPISFGLTSAQVTSEEKPLAAYAVVPG